MIPKVIHRIWVGGSEPVWMRNLGRTWAKHHPKWKIKQWTDSSVRELFPLQNQELYDAALDIAPDYVGQLRADLLRYEILYRYGGLYVDADFECLKPIDKLIENIECFAAWEIQDEWIANGLMGSIVGHAFLERLINGCSQSIEDKAGARVTKLTGPQYLTGLYREETSGLVVLPTKYFYPYLYDEIRRYGTRNRGDWSECYAVHHWNNRRKERKMSHHGKAGR